MDSTEDYLVSPSFYILITPVILCFLFHRINNRNVAINWLVTVISSLAALYGTKERHNILYQKAMDIPSLHGVTTAAIIINTSSTNSYLSYLLLSWIACIIIDGRLSVILLCRHARKMMICRDFQTDMSRSLFQVSAMVLSCLAMLTLSHYVYNSFHVLTKDEWLHGCFFVAVITRTIRIVFEGLVMLKRSKDLVEDDHQMLPVQLLVSNLFWQFQISLMFQFKMVSSYSLLLNLVYVSHGLYHCYKLRHCIYRPQQNVQTMIVPQQAPPLVCKDTSEPLASDELVTLRKGHRREGNMHPSFFILPRDQQGLNGQVDPRVFLNQHPP